MTIIRTCPLCGKENEIEVGIGQYFKWKDGLLVQDAFPDLSPEEREILISGVCSSCQDDIFGDIYNEKMENQLPKKKLNKWRKWN